MTYITTNQFKNLFISVKERRKVTVIRWASMVQLKMINVAAQSAQGMRQGVLQWARDQRGCMFDIIWAFWCRRSFDVDDYTVGQKIIFPMATGTR